MVMVWQGRNHPKPQPSTLNISIFYLKTMAICRSMNIESKLLGLLIFSAAVMGLGAFI
jgi:hypothetical protein